MNILSIVLSVVAIIISVIGVTVSILTLKLQYKRTLSVEIESDCANFARVNDKDELISSFVYLITNTSNLPIFIKEIGFMGILEDGNKIEMIEIGHYEPEDNNQLIQLESQNNINYFIPMKDMSVLIKDCLLKHNIKKFIGCVKCSNGKIYKRNFGDAQKFYNTYFNQFEDMHEYY